MVCSRRDASFLYKAKTRIRAGTGESLGKDLKKSRKWPRSRPLQPPDQLQFECLGMITTHSFSLVFSNTSTTRDGKVSIQTTHAICSNVLCVILLFAVNSSLPTVICTGLVKNVLASLLTDSGQVAETISRSWISQQSPEGACALQLTHQRLSTLFSGRAETNDLSNIVLETLVEHSIGFIEDEVFHANKESG